MKQEWTIGRGRDVAFCPDCGSGIDSDHSHEGGSFTCPFCEELRLSKDVRVARARELTAQLATSGLLDTVRQAIRTLDDMTLDAFEREAKARTILSAAIMTGGQKV